MEKGEDVHCEECCSPFQCKKCNYVFCSKKSIDCVVCGDYHTCKYCVEKISKERNCNSHWWCCTEACHDEDCESCKKRIKEEEEEERKKEDKGSKKMKNSNLEEVKSFVNESTTEILERLAEIQKRINEVIDKNKN